MTADYEAFVRSKLTFEAPKGLDVVPGLHDSLFAFQRDVVGWCLRRGRAALFASTGLGKTRMQIEWARHVPGRVLVLAPLAVGAQTVREARAIGVDAVQARHATDEGKIVVTNYDRLHHFDPSAFTGIVLDESSILKSFDGKTTTRLIESFRATPFRLAATATPSPNDYTELGTHAEFLGICTRAEMLSEYFVNDASDTQKWRLKGHARGAFWRWVASWGALIRKPSDLGYENGGYDLPPLEVTQHTIPADLGSVRAAGLLFAEPASTLVERRAAKKSTVDARVQACAELVNANADEPWLVWCELNSESESLAKAIQGAIEIRGSDDPSVKESRLLGFANGDVRVLVTKARIAGFGMNFQRCARMAFVGVNDSFEAYYQAIRRCWRFGQQRPVHVHVFASELEGNVVANLARKEREARAMAEQLSVETRDAVRAEVTGQTRPRASFAPSSTSTSPSWLRRTA